MHLFWFLFGTNFLQFTLIGMHWLQLEQIGLYAQFSTLLKPISASWSWTSGYSDKLIKADELYKQYDEQLKTAKVNAQAIIAKAEKEAKDSVALEIGEARADAAKLIERTNKELEAQKSTALAQLETQVDELSQLIKEKLLGKEVVL